MAKPAGAIEPSDYGRTIGGEPDAGPYLWDYIYAIFNLPRMPSHWNTDGFPYRQKVKIDWYCKVIMSSTLRCVQRLHNSNGMDYFEGGSTTATAADWGNGTYPITTGAYPKGTRIDELQWTGDAPHGLVNEFAFQHGNTEADSVVYGLYFETTMDLAYTGAFSETNTRYAEPMEQTTYADKPFKDKRPLSSWQMMGLQNSLNNFLYEDRMVWTLPLFGGP